MLVTPWEEPDSFDIVTPCLPAFLPLHAKYIRLTPISLPLMPIGPYDSPLNFHSDHGFAAKPLGHPHFGPSSSFHSPPIPNLPPLPVSSPTFPVRRMRLGLPFGGRNLALVARNKSYWNGKDARSPPPLASGRDRLHTLRRLRPPHYQFIIPFY